MGIAEIQQLIAEGESISTVFARRVSSAYINERQLIEIMACLANANGGTLLIGVDSDGTVSGCFPFHGETTDPAQLSAAVFRHTSPSLPVTVSVEVIEGKPVVAVQTAAAASPVATKWGVYRTRRLTTEGAPECVGMDPAYLFTRYRDANGMDWALAPASGASLADLDKRAIESYRQVLRASHLQELDDQSLLRAIGFYNDSADPVTLGAIALFGHGDALRTFLPYHALTVADRRVHPGNTSKTVRSQAPLGLMLADVYRNAATFSAAYPLVINALLHRDYFLPGPVYVSLQQRGAKVVSPGGLPRGIAAAGGVHAPRSMYLTSAIAHTAITPGAGTGLSDLVHNGTPASFEGSHDQAVVASVQWAQATGNEARVLGVMDRVGDNGASSSDIGKLAGLSTQQAYRALRKLVDQGAIRRTGETRTTRYLPV